MNNKKGHQGVSSVAKLAIYNVIVQLKVIVKLKVVCGSLVVIWQEIVGIREANRGCLLSAPISEPYHRLS